MSVVLCKITIFKGLIVKDADNCNMRVTITPLITLWNGPRVCVLAYDLKFSLTMCVIIRRGPSFSYVATDSRTAGTSIVGNTGDEGKLH